ncbi:MAG TPA: hypothetical protein VIQ50_10285, partial [Xanthobacteraceae bacterium]
MTEPSQDELALFAVRHFEAKQREDDWVRRLANSSDGGFGSLRFQPTQASAIDKGLRVLAYGRTPKFGNS